MCGARIFWEVSGLSGKIFPVTNVIIVVMCQWQAFLQAVQRILQGFGRPVGCECLYWNLNGSSRYETLKTPLCSLHVPVETIETSLVASRRRRHILSLSLCLRRHCCIFLRYPCVVTVVPATAQHHDAGEGDLQATSDRSDSWHPEPCSAPRPATAFGASVVAV